MSSVSEYIMYEYASPNVGVDMGLVKEHLLWLWLFLGQIEGLMGVLHLHSNCFFSKLLKRSVLQMNWLILTLALGRRGPGLSYWAYFLLVRQCDQSISLNPFGWGRVDNWFPRSILGTTPKWLKSRCGAYIVKLGEPRCFLSMTYPKKVGIAQMLLVLLCWLCYFYLWGI